MKERCGMARVKKTVRNSEPIRYAVFTFSFLIFLSGCGNISRSGDSQKKEPPRETLPEYVMKDVTYYYYRDGYLQVKMDFETGKYYAEKEELRIANCAFLYYDINENILSRGRSKRATIYADRSLIIAEDEVVIISELNGGVLETDRLEWHGDKEQFLTESLVNLTRRNIDSITGKGMVADIALRKVTIKKDVRGVLGSTGVD
jgi:LPS export ABC transporter protein LptC